MPSNEDRFQDEIRKPEKARFRNSEESTFRMSFAKRKWMDRRKALRGQAGSAIKDMANEEGGFLNTNPSSILISPLSLHSYPQCKFLIHLQLQCVVL